MTLNSFLAEMDQFLHWAALLQLLAIAAIGLLFFMLKQAEQYEDLIECKHGWWAVLRRYSLGAMAVSMCWAVIYLYDRSWQPWPPVVFFVFFMDVNMFARIIIMRQDMARLRKLKQIWPKAMTAAANAQLRR